jgi:ABC-type cobalamin/Fe3+-siderophores transport system ATPase subunit
LRDISFHVEPGESIAIVGPTGAGKSTLVSLLPRFYDPAQGRILIDGTDIRDLTLASLRAQISLVLQEPLLFSGSIEDNIRYGRPEASREEVRAAAEAANAHDFIEKLPKGYRTKLGERGAKLSGGERQRICVARAFLKDAPILILDEPTSSVDSRTESVILEAMGRLMEGRTTFMIAHRLSTVRNASQILVVNDGELVEHGTHEELLAADGLYRLLHEVQSGRQIGFFAPRSRPSAARAGHGRAQREGRRRMRRPRIVVLGMLTKMPVAGVVWQYLHYLMGFERLGYEAWYVEAHGINPSMFSTDADPGTGRAAAFIASMMRRGGLDGALGLPRAARRRLGPRALGDRAAGPVPLGRPHHQHARRHHPQARARIGDRLVYLQTDPGQLQAELHAGRAETVPSSNRTLPSSPSPRASARPTAGCPSRTASTSCPRASRWCSTCGRRPTGPGPPSPPSGTGGSDGGTSSSTASPTRGASTTSSPRCSTSRRAPALASSWPWPRSGRRDRERAQRPGVEGGRRGLDLRRTAMPTGPTSTARRGELTVAKDQNVRLGPGGSATGRRRTWHPGGR